MTKSKVPKTLFRIGSVAFAVVPLVLAISYVLHFLGEFTPRDLLRIRLTYVQPPPERFMELFRSASVVDFLLPHLLIYLALPLTIPATLAFAAHLARRRPVLAALGTLAALTGTIFMGGIFGMWLALPALGSLRPDQVQGAIPALAALIQYPPMLKLTMVLASLSIIGVAVLAAGMLVTGAIPRWQAGLILAGNATILVFMDIDNLMLVGALAWFVGALPLVRARPPWGSGESSKLTGAKPAVQPA